MKKTLTTLLVLAMVGGMAILAQADPSVNVTVSVTITSSLDITVVSGGDIDFGSMAPNAAENVNATPTVIKNSGSGVNQTYRMYANSPGVWSAGGTAGHNVYVLKAAFNDILPAATDFDTLDNTLGEDVGNEKTASGTVLTIDGDPNGASVPYDENRSIWYKFQPPSSSSQTGAQYITVTITAEEG